MRELVSVVVLCVVKATNTGYGLVSVDGCGGLHVIGGQATSRNGYGGHPACCQRGICYSDRKACQSGVI